MASQGKLAEPTPDIIRKLKELFPPKSDPLPQPRANLSRPPPIVTAESLHKAMQKGVGCDSACGALEMTGELLEPLLQDSDIANSVVTFLNEMLRGTLPAPIATMVSAPRIIAVNKDDGGIRPIGMGDIFYKLAAYVGTKAIEPNLDGVFPRIQYGLGVRGGTQVAFHLIQRAIEADDQSVCIKFDVKNAFNSRRRSSIGKAILDTPELHPIWPLFKLIYGPEMSVWCTTPKVSLLNASPSEKA